MSGYVIIGNSTAGLAGAQALRQHDPCAKITVISGEPHLPYSRVLLTHLIAGHVVRDQLDLTGPEFMDRLGITLLSGSRAVNVELNLKEVLLDSGEKLQYKSLLVAAGSRPVFPDGFSGENPAITGLRTIDDAIKICRHVVPGAKIIVVGGGPVGVKLACALREAGTMPEIIVSSPNLLSQVSDDEAARMVQAMLTSRGIKIRTGVDVVALHKNSDGSPLLVLNNGLEIDCSLIVFCKGVRPNTDMFSGLIPQGGGLKVDWHMRTLFPDVFAAGDVAETYEITRHEYCLAATWPHAVQQGRLAGMNMAGHVAAYGGSLFRNAMEIFGLPFVSMGIIRVPSRENWDVRIMHRDKCYRKLVYRDGNLVGALLVGNVAEAGLLQAEIRRAASENFY